MAIRQEEMHGRVYQLGPTKMRAKETNWDTMPDWSLVTPREVMKITGLSMTALNDRISERSFPQPGRDGKRRVWSLGEVRRWCCAVSLPGKVGQ